MQSLLAIFSISLIIIFVFGIILMSKNKSFEDECDISKAGGYLRVALILAVASGIAVALLKLDLVETLWQGIEALYTGFATGLGIMLASGAFYRVYCYIKMGN